MPSGEHPFDGDMILIKNKNKNKYICESEFDLRESPDWLSQRKKVGSSSSVELHQRDLRLYGPQVRAIEHSHRHDRYCHDHDRCIC